MSTTAAHRSKVWPAINLRLATVDDVDAVTDIAMQILAESPTYLELFQPDPEATRKYLKVAIGSGAVPHILAMDGDRLAGVVSYSIDHSFSDGKCAVMGELFAHKEYRGSPIGRALVSMLYDLAKDDGCVAVHIPIAGGHEAVPTLKNLFRKFGAQEIGVIMRQVL